MISQTLSHYRILEQLGAGGMGVVYRAHDERLDRDVALKVLPPGTLADEAARKRFRKEALTLSRLNHPNIETVHDFDTQGNVDFLVIEYIPGVTLEKRLAEGALTEKEISRLGVQVAEGLAAAQQQGVVHRDLKPSNLLVTEDGRLKILDFGIAKLLQPVTDTAATESFSETRAAAGTLPYMSPEQLRIEKIDSRTDIWAAGAVLYEMATGRRAFPEQVTGQLIDAILHKAPQPPRSVNANVSPDLERIILKCLEKEPEDRYQSARELSVDLRRLGAPAVVAAAPRKPALARRAPLLAVGASLALLAILAGFDVGGWRERLFGPALGNIQSLAVLPLKNISGDPKQDYFAGGMTEQLTTELAQLGALRVTSIVSVMRYRNTDEPVPAIAKELSVDAVVAGAVYPQGDRVRISAQLIRALTDQTLWAASYDRDMHDVLGLQSEVTQAIAREIQLRVSPQVQQEFTRPRKVNPQAYQAYLKGVYGTTTGPMGMGLEDFKEAIKLDPDYAPAYAALARAEYFQGLFGSLSPSQAFPEIRDLAEKALAKDSSLADAYGWRALAETHYDWNWTAAQGDFEHALALNPNQADIHHDYAHYLLAMNRPEDSLAESQRAEELDPFNPMLVACVGWHGLFAHQYDLARDHAFKALKLEAENPWAYLVLGWSDEQKGMYPEALDAFRKAESASMGFPIATSSLGHALAVSGQRAEAQKELADMLRQAKEAYFPAYDIAVVYAGLGDKERAFEWLDKAYQEHSAFLIHVKWDPRLDPLHSDARFAGLIRRLGLPQ